MFLGFSLLVWTFSKLSNTYEDDWKFAVYRLSKTKEKQYLGNIQTIVRAKGFRFLNNKFFSQNIQLDNLWLLQVNEQSSEGQSKAFAQKITDVLPEDVLLLKIKNIDLNPIEQSIESKRIPVVLPNLMRIQRGYVFSGKPVLVPDTITVFGDEEQLRKIHQIALEKVDFSAFNEFNTIEVSLSENQLLPGMVLSPQKVRLSAQVQKLVLERKKVKIEVENPPENQSWALLTDSVEVSIISDLETLIKFNNTKWSAVVDFNRIENQKLPVNLKNLSNVYYKVQVQPREVDYLLFDAKPVK